VNSGTQTAAKKDQPILIACSHGTNDAEGQLVIRGIVDELRMLRPGLDVREAFVDVQSPALPAVVSGLPEGAEAIIVPLLLSTGFHVRVDIAEASAIRPGVRAANPLGPDPRLAAILKDRLDSLDACHEIGVGARAGAPAATAVPSAARVVVASAGSTDPAAAVAVEAVVAMLRAFRPGEITVGFGAGAHPRVPAAVHSAREFGSGHGVASSRVTIASYLLAPGFFYDRLAEAGADQVSAPLAPDPRIAAIALDRYDEAVSAVACEQRCAACVLCPVATPAA
jgi:sirohydrochlorin ferrochelatase